MTKAPLDPEEALAGPLYVVAGLLVFMPALDFVMSVGAPQPGSVQWRFATVGLLSGYTVTPVLGLALAIGVAAFLRHAMVLRAMVILCLTTATLLALLSVGFVLDVLQLRLSIPADGQRAFQSASLRALVKHGLVAIAFAFLGWRARRVIPARATAKPPKTVQIINK